MSGAIAARCLADAGIAVAVFDKGRGVGGRMATRRASEGGPVFDHGAQFMRARGAAFADRLADWRARGVAAPWGEADRYVGIPGMTAPVRDLLAGLPVHSERTVTGLVRDGSGWRLTLAEAADGQRFDAVAVSFPAPQTARLLAASGLSLPGLDRATYAPCWSLMLAFDEDPAFDAPEIGDATGPVAAVFREDSKPGRAAGGTRLVLHGLPAWSRAHLEDTRDQVTAALLDALAAAAGRRVAPIYAAAHRWRYAMVETALGQDCLYDPASGLGACGDWCLGGRIEAAFDSGTALAARLVAVLG